MRTLFQDLKFGLRMLAKNPGFTTVAVLTLALGIGANTAIFSVVNAVLLRPLPYRDPGRLVALWETYQKFPKVWASAPNLYDWRNQSHVFEQIAAYRVRKGFNLAGQGEPQWIQGTFATANLFPMLGVKPDLGRAFTPSADQPGAAPEVVLSHALWMSVFHSSRAVIGRVISLNGKGYTVIGVMPAGFRFPKWAEFWLPFGQMGKGELASRVYHPLNVIARLKAGVTLQQSQSDMDVIAGRLQQQYPNTNKGWGVRVISLGDQLIGNSRRALWILLAATGFVLLIACANVANLLLARAMGRQKELAVRCAVGASRWRLARQLLSESTLLALMGAALGIVLARWGLASLLALGQQAIPRLHPIAIDSRVLAFTLVTALLTGILFGLAPALHASKLELTSALKEGPRTSTAGFHFGSARSVLVAAEMALGLIVLVGSGLLIRSFERLLQVDPGFDPQNILTLRLSLLGPTYSKEGQQAAFYNQLLEKVKGLPGVKATGLTDELPLGHESDYKTRFIPEGQSLPAGATFPVAELRLVYPGYFGTMKIPLVQGRFFTDSDFAESSTPPVIINQELARRFFPGENPIGKRINAGPMGASPSWVKVVGVIGDIKEFRLAGHPRFDLYFCGCNPEMYLVSRTASNPLSFAGPIRSVIQKLDKTVPVSDVATMQGRLSASLAGRRFTMILLSLFGWLSLTLAAVGTYGVISFSVAQRTHEIGIRMALGAGKEDVLRLVGGQGLRLALAGVGIGIVGAFGLTRFMANLLYGVKPEDPLTLAVVSALLLAAALLACYIPARRAARVDPMVALRNE